VTDKFYHFVLSPDAVRVVAVVKAPSKQDAVDKLKEVMPDRFCIHDGNERDGVLYIKCLLDQKEIMVCDIDDSSGNKDAV